MKIEKNLSLIITIATILLSIGGSFGVMQAKTQEIEKIKEKVDLNENKVIAIEVKLDDIKESTKEIQSDLKALIKKIR